MDLVDRTLQEIRERKAKLTAAVSEYAQLLEADQLLTDAFGPLKRAYNRRSAGVGAAAGAHLGGSQSDQVPVDQASGAPASTPAELRLNVQTLTHNPREFEDREVAHVTQEPK